MKNYSEEEIQEVVNIARLYPTLTIEEVLNKVKINPDIEYIAQLVMDYFGIISLKIHSRQHHRVAPNTVFNYLVKDQIKDARRSCNVDKCAEILDKNRCTVLYGFTVVENGGHLWDSRYSYGDSITTHFWKIKGMLEGQDYSGHYLAPQKTQKELNKESKARQPRQKTVIYKKFKLKEPIIMRDLDVNKFTLKDLNLHHFSYGKFTHFKRRLELILPEIYSKALENERNY